MIGDRFFFAKNEAGKFDVFGRASFRAGNAPGSGSIFCVGHAKTEAAARYDVECRCGRARYSLAEFARLNEEGA